VRALTIAEPGMTWDRNIDNALRMINLAKQGGADICKFQWTSSGKKIQERRKVDPKYTAIYERGVQYPLEWLQIFKGHCDSVGIEFACTAYLPEDIEVIAPLVNRFKVSAYESNDQEFVRQHLQYAKDVIVSINPDYLPLMRSSRSKQIKLLHCVSKYPTEMKELGLSRIVDYDLDGLSSHCPDWRIGGIAVAAGAQILEVHFRDFTTPNTNPDYGHSLNPEELSNCVRYVREVEAAL